MPAAANDRVIIDTARDDIIACITIQILAVQMARPEDCSVHPAQLVQRSSHNQVRPSLRLDR